MANSPRLVPGTANLMLQNGLGLLASGGSINLFTGQQPANGGDALTNQVQLVSFPLGNPAFNLPSGGVMSAAPVATGIATVSGVANWFRILGEDGTTVVVDGSVGTAGCDLNLQNTVITAGDIIGITGFTLSLPLQ